MLTTTPIPRPAPNLIHCRSTAACREGRARLHEDRGDCAARAGLAMTTLALFAVAALAFSILAGVIEGVLGRRAQRRLQGKAAPVLHPLTHHGLRRVPHSLSWRALHHVGLFFGFLLVTYVGLLLLTAVHRAVFN
jgi:hypothetical protein